jgi:hypothetical protein
MKKFILKVVQFIFLVVFVQITILISLISLSGLLNFYRPLQLEKNNEIIKDHKVYIIGNSHLECGLNDSILPNQFENIALSGESMFYSIVKMRAILSARNVDTIVFSFAPNSLYSIKNAIADNRLVHNYHRNFSQLTLQEHLFLFQHNLIKSTKAVLSLTPSIFFRYYSKLNGSFKPLDREMKVSVTNNKSKKQFMIKTQSNHEMILKENGFNSLLEIVDSNPATFFLFLRAPVHNTFEDDTYIFNEAVSEIKLRKNSLILDFSNALYDYSFYADNQHLNRSGADSFTKLFLKRYRNIKKK